MPCTEKNVQKLYQDLLSRYLEWLVLAEYDYAQEKIRSNQRCLSGSRKWKCSGDRLNPYYSGGSWEL
jgi:hypothetical protein